MWCSLHTVSHDCPSSITLSRNPSTAATTSGVAFLVPGESGGIGADASITGYKLLSLRDAGAHLRPHLAADATWVRCVPDRSLPGYPLETARNLYFSIHCGGLTRCSRPPTIQAHPVGSY